VSPELPREPLKPIALGGLHPVDRCFLCGRLDSEAELRETLAVYTQAAALICTDVVACLRSRREAFPWAA
jgi:hypothetical protein